MNILFVLYSLPHLSQSSMYSDMVNHFSNKGHHVIAMAPCLQDDKKTYHSIENKIDVIRVKIGDVFNKNLIKKGLSNILLPYQYKKAYCAFLNEKKFDLIIVATPSVMFANFVKYAKFKNNAQVVLLQKDIFPQNAVDLGFMKKNSLIYKFFKHHEIKLLKTADKIGCTSDANVNYLLKNNLFLEKDKLKVIYNSSNLFQKESISKEIRNKYGLNDKFVVVFGGNMGKPQQLENVLFLAKEVSVFEDVLFLIIGTGTEVLDLKEKAKSMQINNILFVEKVPREEYFKLICNCNVGLISLHKDFTVPNTPMKLNDYLNAGIPVLASIDRSNDLGEILVKNKMGVYAYADSPLDLVKQFKILYNDKLICDEYGDNGYKYCINNLSSEKSYNDLINFLNYV